MFISRYTGRFDIRFLLAGKKDRFQHWSFRKKQIVIGAFYGFVACLATQFGIPYEYIFILNARNAAPITAGLVFGAPAGLIAGTMGAIYRAISIYWGVGGYTWLACSLSTFLSGVIAAVCHIFIFDRKRPEWYHGLFIGISSEVTHMLLIFVTHVNDEQKAFEIINRCTIPMIITNSVSIALSLLMLSILYRDRLFPSKKDQKLSNILSLRLYIILVLAFILTSIFTNSMQTRLCLKNANDLLNLEIADTKTDISDLSDLYYLKGTSKNSL